MRINDLLDSLDRDLRFASRGLVRRPAFTFAAVLTLALGIGATTAIFSVVYSVLIKPLPYPNAEDLVTIKHSAPPINLDDLGISATMYLTYRDENRTFAGIGLWQESSATLTDRGDPERVRALQVTDGTLQALGVLPMRGRGLPSRTTVPWPRVRNPSFSLTSSGNGDSAVTRRCSGASFRPRRRAVPTVCLWHSSGTSSVSCRGISDSSV